MNRSRSSTTLTTIPSFRRHVSGPPVVSATGGLWSGRHGGVCDTMDFTFASFRPRGPGTVRRPDASRARCQCIGPASSAPSSDYLTAIPCGRAGPVGNAVLKSRLNRVSSFEAVPRHLEDVDLVVPLELDLPGTREGEHVLDEEVVRDDQPPVVVRQHDVVRPGPDAQIHDGDLRGIGSIGRVEHDDLARLEQAREQPGAVAGHLEDLHHAPRDGRLDVRNDRRRNRTPAWPSRPCGSIR